MRSTRSMRAVVNLAVLLAAPAGAAVVGPAGYVYSPQLLGSPTQSCVAVGPGGTFVAVGPGFKANAQAVVFVQESGATRLVALGFNSVGDCAYDAASNTLYVSDNAGELGGALTGDTIYRITSASTASALPAKGLELLAANSVLNAANIAVDGTGDVYLGNSAGGTSGSVIKIVAGTPSTFIPGLDLAGGLAFDPATANLFVAETLSAMFDSQISKFSPLGAPLGVFAGPGFAFGSYDLAFNSDGSLLATGDFGGNVIALDSSASPTTFASSLGFATGVSVNSFTGRVEVVASPFPASDIGRTIHRFTPIDRLVAGRGASGTECLHEFYGVELVAPAPGRPATKAICTDGAACDADGAPNGRCLFPVGFCLGIDDPDFPTCTPSTIDSFSLKVRPNPLEGTSALAALSASLPLSGPQCFYSDGVTVPVKSTPMGDKPGTGKVIAKATSSGGDVDTDALTLVCNPAP